MVENVRKAAVFIGLTYFVSYSLANLYLALGGRWVLPGSLIVALGYMFIPMAMAIVVQRVLYKEPIREPLGISFKFNRWFLVAWLLPPVVAFATLGISLLFPGVQYTPEMEGMYERFQSLLTPEQVEQMRSQASSFPVHPVWIALLQGLVAGITVKAVAGVCGGLGRGGVL